MPFDPASLGPRDALWEGQLMRNILADLRHRQFSRCCSLLFSHSVVSPWTPRAAEHQAHLSFTISWNFLKLISIESVMPSNHLILCCPLLLLPPIFPSIRVFSNESAHCIKWPKDWSFSFSISPSNEYSGLISFSSDWFDHFAV